MKNFSFSLLFLLCASGSITLAQQPSHPNIVIILADDLGYGDVGFNGCPDYSTPNNNGVLCTNAYVMYPTCSPSRASLKSNELQD